MRPCLTVYKASAGSGKTFTLAIQYIKLLILHDNPAAYSHILAVTFTNKATSEMKDRIIEQLYGIWKGLASSDNYLDILSKEIKESGHDLDVDTIRERAGKALVSLLHDYNRFRVETIDSFFQSILKNLAHELNLVANLKVDLNDEEALNESVDRIIDRLHLTPDVLNLIMEYVNDRITNNENWNISGEIKGFGKCIFKEDYLTKEDALKEVLNDNKKINEIRTKIRDLKEATVDYLTSATKHFREEMEAFGIDFKIFNRGNYINSYLNKLEKEVSSEISKTLLKYIDDPAEMLRAQDKENPELYDIACHFSQILGEIRQIQLHACKIHYSSSLALKHLNPLRLLGVINEEITKLNNEKSRFLLAKTPMLLSELIEDSDAPFIYEKIGAHLNHIMIDEFQDTSVMQWNNFKVLLKEGMSKGFENLIVGDIKQSIYRWRNGDWSILNNLDKEFEAYHPIIKSLTHNYRSERRIIHFNNLLFEKAAVLLNNLDTTSEIDITDAYSDVEQQIPSKRGNEGCVEIRFYNAGNNKNFNDEDEISMLNEMCEKIKSLHAQGVAYKDMAIILRKKNPSDTIIKTISEQIPDANPISDEAFLLNSSLSINMMINALQYINNPEQKIPLNYLVLYYNKYVLHNTFEATDLAINKKHLTDYLPSAFVSRVGELRNLPLYELHEEIFKLFELNKIEKEEAYLYTYFDHLVNYLHDNPADINTFLNYWDNKLQHQSIPSGSIGGIRIITIHKSKGLQFHTVFMPYCVWDTEKDGNGYNNNELLWCVPDSAPYNELPIIPITPTKNMMDSIFAKEYTEEHIQKRIENLNLLYVAFTRSEKNLFVWTSTKHELKTAGSTIGDLVYLSLPEELEGATIEMNDIGEIELFKYGEPSFLTDRPKEKNENRLKIEYTPKDCHMRSYNAHIDFCQSLKAEEFIESMKVDNDTNYQPNDKRRMGIQLHYIFSQIQTHDDIEKALTQLDADGKISTNIEKDELRTIVKTAIENEEINHWFDGSMKLYNECPILSQQINKENGKYQVYRPDRVMIDENTIYIADFKFGEERKKYSKQITDYMKQLQLMEPDKTVKGYLWYVLNNKIEEIKL